MPTVNIATHLKDMARRRPEQLAVLFPAGRDSAGRTAYTSLTFQRLDEDSDHIAAGLMAMGIGRGVRTVLMVPPSLEFFSLTFALFKAGAVPVFVDPGMGLKNIGTCLAEAQPVGFIGVTRAHVARWLFGWGKGTLTKFVSLRGQRANSISMNKTSMTLRDLTIIGRGICDSPAPRPVDTEGLAPGIYDLETRLQQQIQEQLRDGADSLDLVEAVMEREDEFRMGVSRKKVAIAPPRSRIAETAASDMAAILFTSGSTGVPKGAVYSHGNFVAQVELLKNVFGIEPGEIDLCTFPLFALFASALGMTAIVPRMDFTRPARVNPREVIEPIQRFGATNMFGSPALLNAVGRYASRRIDGLVQETMPTLKRVLSAGAPVSAEIIGRFQATLSAGAQVFTPYGATEALPVAVIGSREVLDETRQETAQGAGTCVGRPVEGVQVSIIRITDEPIPEWSDSLLLPPGEIGEIVVRGPQVTSGYFHRPDLTALAKIGEASTGQIRHRMGDLGYFDERGRLWFCGRKSHRVVTPERTYFTEPVEGIFNAHPQVFRTALVGVMRSGAMQSVLCVELEAEARRASKTTLTEELLALGAKHETSRLIQTILFHDAFPVDIRHNSKIFREKLAVWAAKRMK